MILPEIRLEERGEKFRSISAHAEKPEAIETAVVDPVDANSLGARGAIMMRCWLWCWNGSKGAPGGSNWLRSVGHRVVHGGQEFSAPVRVNDTILAKLTALIPLAPLHQPNNLAAIRALAKARPALLQVACFDSGFHATNTPAVTSYALPRALTQEGVRRYGFHGLSYEYIASRLPEFLGPTASGRVVVAHLGHGASMCAMRARRSLATTMGMTALDGLVMGRRCGAIDPGVLLYLMDEKAMGYDELTDLLYRRSGLLGVSQISDDMRTLLKSPAKEAREAVDMFIYRIGRELGSLAAAVVRIGAGSGG